MKYIISSVLILSLLFVTRVFPFAPASAAEDVPSNLSLSGGGLTSAPADDRAPEPGSVTAKYGFRIAKEFIPYVATGLAYTYKPDARTGEVKDLRTGVAAKLGFSYFMSDRSKLRVDYTYLAVSPEQQNSEVRTAPRAIGFGLDIKF